MRRALLALANPAHGDAQTQKENRQTDTGLLRSGVEERRRLMLVRIEAPHFVCGIVLENEVVVEAAPIVNYMLEQKWSADKVRRYIKVKRWRARVIKERKHG
jgi:hypothetical protein